MIGTDSLIWVILGVTTAVCVLSMLGVCSGVIRHETRLHDLRNRVAELQYRYTLQLARLHGHIEDEAEEGEVDVLDAEGDPVPLHADDADARAGSGRAAA